MDLSDRFARFLGWTPLLITLICLLYYPFLNDYYVYYLTPEDGIIEYLTAIAAFAAFCILMVYIGKAAFRKGFDAQLGLLLLFAGACLFFAGEEISWGQRIFGIETESVSPWLAKINRQDELTLHNIRGLDRMRLVADLFCLVWGIFVPYYYAKRPFPILWLRPFMSPRWLVPAYATALLISLPRKIIELLFGEFQWLDDFRIGEFKEFTISMIFLYFAIHLILKFSSEEKKEEAPVIENADEQQDDS
ncbi:MAG: hypothetical protein JXR73_17365 [Candidatus Omnitrophica bacterium]|nr:hypothetical protein [Candidatus Omnitrophota bacterium]